MNGRFRSSIVFVLVLVEGGCSLWSRSLPPADPPLKIVVAPVTMEATIKRSRQIYSFETPPSQETEPSIRAKLIQVVEVKAQEFLTQYLAEQPGFTVVPFTEARRLISNLRLSGLKLDDGQLHTLGKEAGADILISARIDAYGSVPWKYWLTGLATQNVAELIALGLATGWNPIAIGVWFGTDVLLIDLPLWAGGAYIFGWAFRPVEVEVKAMQMDDCSGRIWKKTEFVNLVPGKTLARYLPEDRKKKEVQLAANLDHAMANIAESAGKGLRKKSCSAIN
jgi:hypothetical protein